MRTIERVVGERNASSCFVITLREPVARAYSEYQMKARRVESQDAFLGLLRRNGWPLLRCVMVHAWNATGLEQCVPLDVREHARWKDVAKSLRAVMRHGHAAAASNGHAAPMMNGAAPMMNGSRMNGAPMNGAAFTPQPMALGVARPDAAHALYALELLSDARQVVKTHVDHQSITGCCQCTPVHRRTTLIDLLMAGHKRDRGARIAMGHWNAGVGRCGNPSGHPRHHLHGNAPLGQIGGFLTAPPE